MASLPCPSLPCRALSLIREYSKPLTRPEWRKSNPVISQYKLYSYVSNNTLENFKLKEYLIRRIQKTDWYYIYIYIRTFGIDQYYCYVGYTDVLHIDGIMDAEIDYQNSIMEYESYHLRLRR
jgi:hypothetical protein